MKKRSPSAALETAPQASGARHLLSEIVAPDSPWEKVAAVAANIIEGINFDREGNLWVVDITGGKALKIVGGKTVAAFGEKHLRPNGARFHKDGRLFIADQLGELYFFNVSTGERTKILQSYGFEHMRGFSDLIFDNKGGLYITESYGSSAMNSSGRVFYLPPDKGAKLQLFQENMAFPNGIAVSADGNFVYIAEWAKNRIIAVPAVNGNIRWITYVFCRFEGGIGPDGLAVDAEGNVYAAHFHAGEIAVCDANGFSYGAIRLPASAGIRVSNLAFHEGYLYVTESLKNEIWRIKVKKSGLQPYGLQ
jgi:sugar lactone lactonase YvrE